MVEISFELSVKDNKADPVPNTKLKVPGIKLSLYLFLSTGRAIKFKEEATGNLMTNNQEKSELEPILYANLQKPDFNGIAAVEPIITRKGIQ